MKHNAPTYITSPNNLLIKQFIKLHQAKHRKELGLCLIETLHPVEEAIKVGLEFIAIAISETRVQQLQLDMSTIPQVVKLPEILMQKISTTDTAPEVIAIAKVPISKKQRPSTPFILLWELQDPGNVGTIIRSAVAFGFSQIISLGGVEIYSPKVIRASAGQLFRCHIQQINNLTENLNSLVLKEIHWYGLDAHTGENYKTLRPEEPYAIILGSEGHGLPEESFINIKPVHIPMLNNVESLNVSIAGSILMSQLFKR